MYGPAMVNTSYQGAIVSVYNAGQAIGGLTVGYLADKYSRKYTIFIASFLRMYIQHNTQDRSLIRTIEYTSTLTDHHTQLSSVPYSNVQQSMLA
jgi:hypothetical protein